MKPSLAAQHHPDCYPSDRAQALTFFREAFLTFPASSLRPAPERKSLLGIVTPHIDFRVSLPAYSAAFQTLLDVPLAETYLILGVGHRSRLEWNLDPRTYVTPLGEVACAPEIVDRLSAHMDSKRVFSPEAHEGEHSIEFPLLWLQALHHLHPSKASHDFRFVPLLCGGLHEYIEGLVEWDDLEDFHQLSGNLARLLQEFPEGKQLRIICSIDGCHLGPRFRHPFRVTSPLLKATEGWEDKLWNQVAQGDARAFLDWLREEGNDRYFDGVGALALLLATGSQAKAEKITVQRTFYEQWFTERDASAVTFSSGRILFSAEPSPSISMR